MASTRERFTKDGQRYYEIRCRCGRNKPEASTRWYVPTGLAEKTIQKRLADTARDFERSVKEAFKNGEAVTHKQKKVAEAQKKAEEAKIQTFKQYTEKVYLPALEVTAAKHTLSNFRGNLKNHIFPRIGDMKMPEITAAEIKALLLEEQKDLGYASVGKLYTILRLVFKDAFENGIIKENPMFLVHRPTAKKEEVIETEPESYTAQETLHILECLENEPLQWKCYVKLLIDTGCRRGEACGLKWKNIDLENNSVSFENQLAYTPENGVYEDTLKNQKKRRVFIDPELTELLKALQKSQTVKVLKGNGYVFTQGPASKLPLHPDSPTRYFKKFGAKYGINHFHPHKCRHTQASLAITNGADVVSVSQKLGHSDVSITLKVYAHASEESQKRASDIFRLALESAKKPEKKSGTEK